MLLQDGTNGAEPTEIEPSRREGSKSWNIVLSIGSRPECFSAEHLPNSCWNNKQQVLVLKGLWMVLTLGQYGSPSDRHFLVWERIEKFAKCLWEATSPSERSRTECTPGIEVDNAFFSSEESIEKIRRLKPTEVTILYIGKELYGKVCRIWNLLGHHSKNDFLVVLGGDVRQIDHGWQAKIETRFEVISFGGNLPFGAACVAFNDFSFEGVSTFLVIHRWYMER